jgi:hypothetical protein
MRPIGRIHVKWMSPHISFPDLHIKSILAQSNLLTNTPLPPSPSRPSFPTVGPASSSLPPSGRPLITPRHTIGLIKHQISMTRHRRAARNSPICNSIFNPVRANRRLRDEKKDGGGRRGAPSTRASSLSSPPTPIRLRSPFGKFEGRTGECTRCTRTRRIFHSSTSSAS